MSNPKIKKYSFTQSITGIEAFVGTFEKKIQEIHDDIPVMFLNNGDETYFFNQKFEKVEDRSDIYLKTPRIVFNVEDASLQTDQNTNQYVYSNYIFREGIWRGQFRRQSLMIPISVNLVNPNFMKSMEYFDMLASLLSIDNVFTYNFLGNTHDASYTAQNYSFEKAPIENSSSSKNHVVKAALELVLQIMYPRYNTLDLIDGFAMNEEDKVLFGIVTNSTDGTQQIDNLNTDPDDCNCETT